MSTVSSEETYKLNIVAKDLFFREWASILNKEFQVKIL